MRQHLTKRILLFTGHQIPLGIIGQAEDIEKVICVICSICCDYFDNLVAFDNCPHMLCQTCFDSILPHKGCPSCKKTKGPGPGKLINVSNLRLARKADVANDYGLRQETREASEAAVPGSRPADLTERQWQEIRLREAINEAELDLEREEIEIVEAQDPTFETPSSSRRRTGRQGSSANRPARRPRLTRAQVNAILDSSESSDDFL